jgi:Glycosyltransferase 61
MKAVRNKRVCLFFGVLLVGAVIAPVLIRLELLQTLLPSGGYTTMTAYANERSALPVGSTLYSFNRFKELNGKPATYSLRDFRFTSLIVVDGELQENVPLTYNEAIALGQTPSAVCQAFCRVPANSFGLGHFPHFLQQAYPCWTAFQRFRSIGGNYIILPEKLNFKGYIQSFLDAIKYSTWEVSILYGNESLPVVARDVCGNESQSLLVERTFKDTGWHAPVRWFMNNTADVEQLQMAVLGSDFKAGPSSWSPAINILILDRKGSSRDWAFASDAAKLLDLELGKLVKVTHLKSFTGLSLRAQAKAVHSADIIVSPHGAQLANLAYIRPCTMVVELFPRGYYLQFFQSLVISARGFSYEGYPTGGDRYEDTIPTSENITIRYKVRSDPVLASPSSLLDVLPELIDASRLCRSQLA